MTFSNPEVFWAILLLVPAWFLLYRSYLQGQDELQRIGGAWRGPRLHAVYVIKGFFSALLLLGTFILLIAALAGPSWGRAPVEEPQDGLDIAVAVDVSRSMTASDVTPSRLDQAKELVRTLLSSFPSARFSLVAFEGIGVTLTPLTADRDVLARWVEELGPSLVSSTGTNLAAGLDEALRTIGYSALHHRVVVFLSDGEARDGNALTSARRAESQGIEVFTVGLGTVEGGRIPDKVGVLKDDFGFPVVTKRVDGTLSMMAQETGGKYFLASDRAGLRLLQDQLSTLGNPGARGGVGLESVPQYRFFLLLGLVTLTGFLLVRILPWRGIF